MATFFPLQGFWNALIYFRPRFLKYREMRRSRMPRSFVRSLDHISESSLNSDCSESKEELPSEMQLEVETVDIWRQVKLRQAQIAIKRAEEDERIRIEREKEQQSREMREEGSGSMSFSKPMEIWKRVKMRQLERAEAAVRKAEDDEKEELEQKKEQERTIRLDPDQQDEEDSSVDFMDSAELERRVISILPPSPGTPKESQSKDLRKSFWKTVLPL